MSLLEHREAIAKYYETIREKYPNLSLEQVEAICRTPAEFIKKIIREGGLQDIYIKYVGKLKPSKDRLIKYRNTLVKFRQLGYITEEHYNRQIKRVDIKLHQIKIKDDKEINFNVVRNKDQ